MYSALILAGGKGSRLGYREKALIDVNGKPLISFVVEALEKVVDNIIISVRDRAQGEMLGSILSLMKSSKRYSDLWVHQTHRFAYDEHKNMGPIAGILSGLEACEDEYCFIAACDMPFINGKVVELLFRKCEDYEAAIPRWEDGFLEPLHAVYRCKPMIREAKRAIGRGETIILAPIFKLNVNYIGIDEIRKYDPNLKTFRNVNTHEDIQKISF